MWRTFYRNWGPNLSSVFNQCSRDSGQQRSRNLLAKSPCLNYRTGLELPKIVPLCAHGCFARAAQLAHRSCPDSKFPVLHLLAGKLSVYRGTALRNDLFPCIILELASPDAHNSPHLHRANSKWKLCLTGSNVIFLLLHIFSTGNKQKELVL